MQYSLCHRPLPLVTFQFKPYLSREGTPSWHLKPSYHKSRVVREQMHHKVTLLLRIEQQRRNPGSTDNPYNPILERNAQRIVKSPEIVKLQIKNAALVALLGSLMVTSRELERKECVSDGQPADQP